MTNDYSSRGLKSLFLIESTQSLSSFYVSFDLVTTDLYFIFTLLLASSVSLPCFFQHCSLSFELVIPFP